MFRRLPRPCPNVSYFLLAPYARLELFFLDPLDAYRLVKTVSVKWDIDETCLHKHGVLCDGGRLIMLGPQHEEGVKRTPGIAQLSRNH